MAFLSFPDIWTWIQNLPPMNQWKSNSMLACISSCPSPSQPSLKLAITKYQNSSFNFSIQADYNIPINLWTSKPFPENFFLHNKQTMVNLLLNFVIDILNYSQCPSSIKLPSLDLGLNLKQMFNFSLLSLTFLVCIYEAPSDIRSGCLNILKSQFACPLSREVSLMLMRVLGSNVEEQWMRSINLALTNWINENQVSNSHHQLKAPSPLYSYSLSAFGLWKVQLYCPVIAMDIENSSQHSDDKLMFSLNYHQLEGVIQLNHRVIVREKWIEVMINIDNIRCDIIRLINENLMNERGAGTAEKHFPSRISLQVTPILHTNVLSVSVSKSTQNPAREIGMERGIEASLEPANPFSGVGINFSAGESMTMSLKPWKFEQSVYGNRAILNWFLHDTSSSDGKEVVSSRPSKMSLLQPRAWFKNRYTTAHRPFNKAGGVIFAGDEYGDRVCWKVDKRSLGKSMEWEIKGWIWLTYWPNKHRTLYSETRRAEFREVLQLTLA